MQPRSSVFFQILLYCNAWYCALYFVVELLLFVYKGQILPYPNYNLAAEVVLLFVFAGVEALRNFFGQKGNLTEELGTVIISLVLTVPSLLTAIYFLIWQTYVLRLEVILQSFQLTFVIVEVIFAIVAVASFARFIN